MSASPFVFEHQGSRFSVGYEPGESNIGPVRRQLELARPDLDAGQLPAHRVAARFHHYYGDDFRVECPTGSGRIMTLREVATNCRGACRASSCATTGGGRCSATRQRHRNDPAFRDHVLFHEYFHGDTGRGLGASHQTGWTGLVALLLAMWRATRRKQGRGATRRCGGMTVAEPTPPAGTPQELPKRMHIAPVLRRKRHRDARF